MRKALLITSLLMAALPALAQAKTGVSYQKDPETAKVGERIPFTAIVWREPPSPSGKAHPLVGIHPLVTFRSDSGRVIRVRASRTNANGMGRGAVAFTDKGPWTAVMHIKSHGIYVGSEDSQPIGVGTGLVQTIPPAARTAKPQPPSGGSDFGGSDFPWVWVLSLASIGAALLVFVMRRRGRWGAA